MQTCLMLMIAWLQYDKNRSKALEFEELRSVLGDLGMLVSCCICLLLA